MKTLAAYMPPHLIWPSKQIPHLVHPRKEFPLGEDAKEMSKQLEAINRELQQDWTLPKVYQRALRNVQHFGQTTMMELVHFMFIQARYVFRGRIPDAHHHNLFHNFIMPVIAAYGPAGECVLEEVEETMPRMKRYIAWVADELGDGFVSLVLHLMSHCDILVRDAGGMRTNTMRYETSNFIARCGVCFICAHAYLLTHFSWLPRQYD